MWRDVHTGNLTNAMAYRDVLTGELKNLSAGGGRTTKETFSGDGSKTVFPLANAPIPGSDLVFVQGATASAAYSLSGSNLVFSAAPATGVSIVIQYQY